MTLGFISTVHYFVGWALILFLVIRVYQCTLGDRVSSLFRGTVDGVHRGHITMKDEDTE